MSEYLTLLGTALNKRPRQLAGIATRILKSQALGRLPVDVDARYERAIPAFEPVTEPLGENARLLQASVTPRDRYREHASAAARGELAFLGETVHFEDGTAVSLGSPRVREQSLHWQLKCYGFEHLGSAWLGYRDPGELPEEELSAHEAWLADWRGGYPVAADPTYLRGYWMPHSVCLRVLNWARYDAVFRDRLKPAFREGIRECVYKNGAFLSDNVEHGVGGNHLVENAAALVVAGVYADEPGWRRQGRRLFERAADGQFFADGGHVERSPMYHLLVCQRYVTATDLLERVGEGSETIRACARRALGFVRSVRPPDGRIPLFNDSVFGEALALAACLDYGERVGLSPERRAEGPAGALPGTGYYWLGEGEDRLLVAAHEVTVPHLPGHAHAHPGHVSLWVGGERVLTDTGVYEYAAGERRQRARSVASHNTVQVAGTEPVRLGSSFWGWGRVDPTVEYEEGRLRMAYSVGGLGRPTYGHERTVTATSAGWRVTDTVECDGGPVTSRLHVHPGYDAAAGDGRVDVTGADGPVLAVEAFGADGVSVEQGPYYPRYGCERERDVVVLRRDGSGTFGVEIKT